MRFLWYCLQCADSQTCERWVRPVNCQAKQPNDGVAIKPCNMKVNRPHCEKIGLRKSCSFAIFGVQLCRDRGCPTQAVITCYHYFCVVVFTHLVPGTMALRILVCNSSLMSPPAQTSIYRERLGGQAARIHRYRYGFRLFQIRDCPQRGENPRTVPNCLFLVGKRVICKTFGQILKLCLKFGSPCAFRVAANLLRAWVQWLRGAHGPLHVLTMTFVQGVLETFFYRLRCSRSIAILWVEAMVADGHWLMKVDEAVDDKNDLKHWWKGVNTFSIKPLDSLLIY